jgi:hypothetical protein
MRATYQWTAWNLTPDGWHCSQTAANPADVTRHRPPDTLLALLSMRRVDDPHGQPLITVIYRSADRDAVAEALAKYGGKPSD